MKTGVRRINLDTSKEIGELVESLAGLLSYEETERFDELKVFWCRWLLDKIEGEKITVIAEETYKEGNQEIVGVVRFWKTPYYNNKWLIEGLEVILHKRRQGIAEQMIQYGLKELRQKGVKEIAVNIRNNNIPSIKVHEKLGFIKVSSGAINSYGDYKKHIDEYNLHL